MDRDKLAQLRLKNSQNKAKKHQELLDSNTSIKDAVDSLKQLIEAKDNTELITELGKLKDSFTFKDDIALLTKSIEDQTNQPITKDNFQELIDKVGSINNNSVILAINNLAESIEDQDVGQEPEDYKPVRRVIKVGGRLVFDDSPSQVNVSGGGGGGIQSRLIRNKDAIAVVNPDGTPIASGGGGGGNVNVTNFPTDYPLPSAQISALTPQTDALTDNELRATPVDVDTGLTGLSTATNQTNILNQLPLKAGLDYNKIAATYPTDDTEVYTYKLTGTTIQTITVIYTDATKEQISEVDYA